MVSSLSQKGVVYILVHALHALHMGTKSCRKRRGPTFVQYFHSKMWAASVATLGQGVPLGLMHEHTFLPAGNTPAGPYAFTA